MEHNILGLLEQRLQGMKNRRRWRGIISLVDCLAFVVTISALTLPAISQSDETFCGMEEHTHGDECYMVELVCEEGRSENTEKESASDAVSEEDTQATALQSETETVIIEAVSPVLSFSENTAFSEEIETVIEITTLSEEVTVISETITEIIHTADVSAAEENGTDEAAYSEPETYREEITAITEITTLVETETEVEKTTEISVTEETASGDAPENTAPPETSEGHEHTEECYKKILKCEKEEHTHTEVCLSDTAADLETEEDWKETFSSVSLTDDTGADLLAIAETQKGYTESTIHYTVGEDGKTRNGYTRYGEWYGEPYCSEWNSVFVAFCAHYAKIESVPKAKNPQSWITILSEENSPLYREFGDYTPVPGDIILLDTDNNGSLDRTGIIESLNESRNEFTVIEGDVEGTVDSVTYILDEISVIGFIIHPEHRTNRQVILEEQSITAEIFTDESHITPSDDKSIITIKGMLPVNATAKAHPVVLESDFVEGQALVVAYDITITDESGNVFNQTDNGDKFVVTIEPPEWNSEDDHRLSVYYVPDSGEPQSMNVIQDKDAISFETEHFSVYAVTRSGTLSTVYLNGKSGNDENAGNSANAAVKTFSKALELLADNGTIYISGTVTITGKETWSLGSGQKIQRYSSFSDALITVSSGGELVLKNITINGGANNPSSSNIATNSTYATGYSKGPIIHVDTGGTAKITGGAVLENNSNQPNSSNNKLVESGYIGMGGAVNCEGTLIMTGGIIRNCEAQCGGGVYVENGTFYMSGGTIDNNYARDIVSYRNRMENYHKNAGGGVYVGDYADMYLSGGTISNNKSSREGGGISLGWLNRSNGSAISSYITTFTMTGGTVTGNYAESTGGGINVTAGREAIISAGYITNNTAKGNEYQDSDSYVNAGTSTKVFSGGGIYIDAQQWDSRGNSSGVAGRCEIHRVIVTDNEAEYYGGGLASCSTSNTTVGAEITLGDGTAIYENTADNGKELYIYSGTSSIGSTVLGGGKYNWSKSGYYYDNSLTDTSSAIVTAKTLATVYITGNVGYLGGGIGCNGVIIVGGDDDKTSITIEKRWVDTVSTMRPDFIEIQVYQNGKAYGDPIRIYPVINENGEEKWPVYRLDELPVGYTYTISEVNVPGYTSTVKKDSINYIITNTATGFSVQKKWVGDDAADRPESITVQLYQNGVPYGEPTVLTDETDWAYLWQDLPEKDAEGNDYIYTAHEVEVPDGYMCTDSGSLDANGVWVIENTKLPETSVSVVKRWADGVAGADSITVRLLANGEEYGSPVSLSPDNQWFYLWENLPAKTQNGEDIIYTVTEDRISGYYSEIYEGTYVPRTRVWEQVTSLTAGNTYMLVSSDGALAANTSGDTLRFINVMGAILNGTDPDSTALWTYNSNKKLINANGKYLNMKSSGSNWSPTYTYNTATSSSYYFTYSDEKLYGSTSTNSYGTKRYFTGINASGYGTTTTSATSTSITEFTAYTLSETTLEPGELHYEIMNTPRDNSLTISFIKYCAKQNDDGVFPVLSGAELSLYRWVDGGEMIPGTSYTGDYIDSWTSESLMGSVTGKFEIDLDDGIYYLFETKAPNGYAELSAPIIFEVDSGDGTITVIQYPDLEEMLPEFSEDGVIYDDGENLFPVFNARLYELPATGGAGTLPFTLGGLLLMATALALLLYKKLHRKEERLFS